jgi:hypothetical protein
MRKVCKQKIRKRGLWDGSTWATTYNTGTCFSEQTFNCHKGAAYHGKVVYFVIFRWCFFPWYKGSLRDNYFNRNFFYICDCVKGGTSERCYRTRRGRTDEQRYAIISPYFDGRIKMNGPNPEIKNISFLAKLFFKTFISLKHLSDYRTIGWPLDWWHQCISNGIYIYDISVSDMTSTLMTSVYFTGP